MEITFPCREGHKEDIEKILNKYSRNTAVLLSPAFISLAETANPSLLYLHPHWQTAIPSIPCSSVWVLLMYFGQSCDRRHLVHQFPAWIQSSVHDPFLLYWLPEHSEWLRKKHRRKKRLDNWATTHRDNARALPNMYGVWLKKEAPKVWSHIPITLALGKLRQKNPELEATCTALWDPVWWSVVTNSSYRGPETT